MVAKRDARVTTTGPSSRAVVLPADWVRGTRIAKGSQVEVWYGDLLLVVPPGKEAAAERLLEAVGGSL